MRSSPEKTAAAYPPDEHFLRDLGHWLEWDGEAYRAGLRAIPELGAAPGGVRAGVWAALADTIGGAVATRAVQPNWIATSDLSVHIFSAVRDGEISATARLLRQGRRTAVVEIELFSSAAPDEPVGLATVGFSVLEARGDLQRSDHPQATSRTEFGHPDRPLSEDILTRVGVHWLDARAGQLSLKPNPRVRNTLGAVQGGVLALLADAAGEARGRAEGRESGVTCDLALHYLAQGKTGPLETRTRVLARGPDGARVRVEILDRGQSDRLVAVATNRVCAPA